MNDLTKKNGEAFMAALQEREAVEAAPEVGATEPAVEAAPEVESCNSQPGPDVAATGETVDETTRTEIDKIKLEIRKLESAEDPQVLYLAPNKFNVLVYLLNWRDAHNDADKYVFTCSGALDDNGRALPMTLDALIAEYEKTMVGFAGIQSVLADCIRFLMLNSTLMGITISACFIDPQQGPAGVSLSSVNTYMDNDEVVKACEAITFKAAANALQKQIERKKANKGDIIMPDKKIVVPGVSNANPQGKIII